MLLTSVDGRKSFEPQQGHVPAASIVFLNQAETASFQSKYQNAAMITPVPTEYAVARFTLINTSAYGSPCNGILKSTLAVF